jgi:hypothetical protein
MSEPTSISRVTPSGKVERLGQWVHRERVLELDRDGFPLRGPGRHQLEGELPWIFWDMCPSGYLGRRLQRKQPQLRLAEDPNEWTAEHVLHAITQFGSDLAGNLLIGDEAVRQFRKLRYSSNPLDHIPDLKTAREDAEHVRRTSALGGERPKLLITTEVRAHLVKFPPRLKSPTGQRWRDLLRVEALCSQVLRAFGVNAARSKAKSGMGQMLLVVERFDRTPPRGRVGVGTLYFLALERWGDMEVSGPEVLARLHREGAVDVASVETCTLVHSFSAAIGNNDAHLGNYALMFDDDGRASLAPIYDVLPMIFAPRNDELPDQWITPRSTPIDPAVAPWVDALVRAVEAEPEISLGFKDLWRRYVGA